MDSHSSQMIDEGDMFETDREKLVQMVEAFIPTIDYCSLSVEFFNGISILLISGDNGGYCLYDKTSEQQYNFKTKKELAQKARTYYLNDNEIVDVRISGFSLLKE